jgi:hypothetical protein
VVWSWCSYVGGNKCDTVNVELFWELWELCLWCIWNPCNSISQCTGSQMLIALDLTKHLRMRRHRNFVNVGSACRKSPQNRFVPVYKHWIVMGRKFLFYLSIYFCLICFGLSFIIIIFINCKWVDTWWQWSIYILHMHGQWRLITLDLVGGGLHGKHVVATRKGKMGMIPTFALGPRKTKKNLCRDGRSQDLPVTDF